MKIVFRMVPLMTVCFFAIVSCKSGEAQEVVDVDVEQVKELAKQPDILILDVRTPEEFGQGRITGARMINFLGEDFDVKIAQLDKDQPIVVYCAKGGRSSQAAKRLDAQGFKTIYNYSGGFNDWKAKGEPIEK